MDIKKELEIINNDTQKNVDEVIDLAFEQIEIANKKAYILQAVDFANNVKRLANTIFFKEQGISFIRFSEQGISYFYDKDNNPVELKSEKIVESYKKLRHITPNFSSFDKSYRSDNFDDKVDLQGNIRNQILDIVLSKELKAIVDYNEMNAELKENNISTKKLKL